MAVVISEFEVIMEEPEPPAEGEVGDAEVRQQPQLSPQDIHNIIRRRLARALRLWAH